MFEISIFKGDPVRGKDHDGYMFSLCLSDGSYYKHLEAYVDERNAVFAAAACEVRR